jgi:hypothetical protein
VVLDADGLGEVHPLERVPEVDKGHAQGWVDKLTGGKPSYDSSFHRVLGALLGREWTETS